jgi:tetratricopeptide (TPR) repeat protein
MAEIHNGEWNVDGRAQSLEAALVHARASGDTVELNEIVNYLAGVLTISLAPADATIARLEELLEEAQLGPVARLSIRVNLGLLYARRGDFERAKAGIGTAQESAREFGLTWSEARMAEPGGWTYLLAGDPATAEREFQRGIELFEAMGDRARRATVMLWLAEAVYRQERFDEAFEIASAAEGLGQEEFPAVRAKVLARRGELDEAVRLARVAAAFPGRDALTTAWLLDAAEVFGRAGLRDEARELIDEVHARAEQSGNVVMAADAARALDALHEDAPASS